MSSGREETLPQRLKSAKCLARLKVQTTCVSAKHVLHVNYFQLIGMFCVNEWMRLGQPKNLQIVEFGPGRGTLSLDMTRVSCKFIVLTHDPRVFVISVFLLVFFF